MREIKFRGMDLQGRWFYGNYAVLHKDLRSTGNKAGHYISNSAGAPFAYAVRPETVGQYTGLKDEEGTEIYHGDQLYAKGNLTDDLQYVGDVEWDDDDARWEVANFYGRFEYIPSGCYVRGSIYEQKEVIGASAPESTESA